MMNNRGLSIVELLVGLIIGTIIILTIGVISSISQNSYKKVWDEGVLYNDIAYGVKMMQNRMRQAESVSLTTLGGVWLNQRINLGSEAFGVCQASGSSPKNLVYMKTANSACTNPEIIFSVLSSETLSLTPSLNGNSLTIQISGSKNKIPFDISTTILRRQL